MNEQRQELDERIADDERHAATMRKARDYDDLLARAEAAEARVAELEAALDEARGGVAIHRAISDAANRRVAELEAALAAERAWPSASEPPEESGDYIGYDGKSVMCVRFDAHEDADEDWPWADMDGTFVPVTHWQVLPPAPQEPR